LNRPPGGAILLLSPFGQSPVLGGATPMKPANGREQAADSLRLFTIGYEGRTLESFAERLKDEQVCVVIDVRELPLSRKKGFSKTALAESLGEEGIEYRSLRALGAPRAVRHRLHEDGDYTAFFAAYSEHMRRQAGAIEELSSLLSEVAICLMCYEADPRQCHRSAIASELEHQHGLELEVKHL
jgi:uncharacterized protein (DUF488 family)